MENAREHPFIGRLTTFICSGGLTRLRAIASITQAHTAGAWEAFGAQGGFVSAWIPDPRAVKKKPKSPQKT